MPCAVRVYAFASRVYVALGGGMSVCLVLGANLMS